MGAEPMKLVLIVEFEEEVDRQEIADTLRVITDSIEERASSGSTTGIQWWIKRAHDA
jgi:hypothetical protein